MIAVGPTVAERGANRFGGMLSPVNVTLPPGLEPASMNALTVAADVPTLLVIELDGGRVYLDDVGNLFALPAHAAIRDRLHQARPRRGTEVLAASLY